jgi:hypothetical protein
VQVVDLALVERFQYNKMRKVSVNSQPEDYTKNEQAIIEWRQIKYPDKSAKKYQL